MNTKNNRRRMNSQARIREIFLELLRHKDLADITVAELCERAGINRSTFYANFDGIYGLAEAIYEDLSKEVHSIFEVTFDSDQCVQNFFNLFEHIRNNQELYKFYFKLGYEKKQTKMESFISNEELACERAVEYRIEFFKSGFNAIVKLWLDHGCRESSQMMCDILLYEYRNRIEPYSCGKLLY